MPAKSPAQTLFDKAEKKANSSSGWFSSSNTKFEEAGDLYQQAANAYKIDKLFKEAGDCFAREAECRENCKEQNEAANAWWNAAKAYKRGYPDCTLMISCPNLHILTDISCDSGYSGFEPDHYAADGHWSLQASSR